MPNTTIIGNELIEKPEWQVWGHRREWSIMLIAYGDDSSDGTKSRVYAAAAIVAKQEEWEAFYSNWREVNGDRPFHATDCESGEGDFAQTSHDDNKALYAHNVRLLVDSPLIGQGVSISIQDYRRIFPFAHSSHSDEWPYYMCFSGALACVAQIGHLSVPQERVKVTFDHNNYRDYNAGWIYDCMVHQPSWEPATFLDDTITFANHRSTIGLQAADLLAYESMKDLDNRLTKQRRWTRLSLIELRKCGRFDYLPYDGPRLATHRVEADALHADPERGKAYLLWLYDKQINDSLQARLRFMNLTTERHP